jgi:hypothetical protein
LIDKEAYYGNIVAAVSSIREQYYAIISEHRELIGAETVLDMIDASLRVNEDNDLEW